MESELAKAYNPEQAHRECLALWDKYEIGHINEEQLKKEGTKNYSIVIPPPNVTGALHIGHALNNTLQDVLIRWRRMQGYHAMWLPGTDHAGIATQAVVEKRIIQTEKKSRHELGRENLVGRIWQWKDQYEKRILNQLRQMGCSCDWQRTRFTLDPICARAVRETFFSLFQKGYIQRGNRLVNWDTHLQTSVADDETIVEETKGGFWTFHYPIEDSEELIRFSTTRPETMLGDTAICVHPDDQRYQHLIGKKAIIPLNGRAIPIIADGKLADPSLGTGAVKVTPAHDPNDYACGLRHQLPMINILNPNGTINENGAPFTGLDRYTAREKVIQAMKDLNCFEGHEDRLIPLAYSDRSKTPIEPYLSEQWFVQMGDRNDGRIGLAQLAMDAVVSGKIKIYPERYAKSYLEWLGEKRDWCISRQLWWGHRIPIWYTQAPREVMIKAFANRSDIAYREVESSTPSNEPSWMISALHDLAGNELGPDYRLHQDEDVLDTWFSSALWPLSTLGWPERTAEFEKFYPTSVLVTSRDIITLWVVRMAIMGLLNTGQVPFHQVYVHPKMLDGLGVTMSKTRGNGVDPLDIIRMYGADALRYQMVSLAGETQDSRLPVSNICPHCGALNSVKREHMNMQTRKVSCLQCKKNFRPGGPWPSEDEELPTAIQASERFEIGRNFANKLWNAGRFILMNLGESQPVSFEIREDLSGLPIEDLWILSRLASTVKELTKQLEAFRFSETTRIIYEFVWSDFCDWYIEMSKGRLKDEASKAKVETILLFLLDQIVRFIHPIMPFVSESMWQLMNERFGKPRCFVSEQKGIENNRLDGSSVTENPSVALASVALASWPELSESWINPEIESRFAQMQLLIRSLREVRNRYQIDTRIPLQVSIRCHADLVNDFNLLTPFIHLLGRVGDLQIGENVVKLPQSATVITSEFELYCSLVGLIDPIKETERLKKQLLEKENSRSKLREKLEKGDFRSRAPQEIIQQHEAQLNDLEAQILSLQANLKDLEIN